MTEGRRLRSDKPVYQASDLEIQHDLQKMKYVKKVEILISVDIPIKTDLPKKRKPPVDDDKYVIDCLVKLMNTKPLEQYKPAKPPKPLETIETKIENTAKPMYTNQIIAAYMNLQNQFIRNSLCMQQFQYFQNPNTITSTSDKHMRSARFIQEHKSIAKNCIPKKYLNEI